MATLETGLVRRSLEGGGDPRLRSRFPPPGAGPSARDENARSSPRPDLGSGWPGEYHHLIDEPRLLMTFMIISFLTTAVASGQ